MPGKTPPENLCQNIVSRKTSKDLFVEINFRKSKWLLGGTKHPPSQPDQYFLTIQIKP